MLSVMEAGDRVEILRALQPFRERGIIQYSKSLEIPAGERIPALLNLERGRERISASIAASLTSAMQNINLRVGLSPEQIFELSEAIIDQSHEDNLGLEDILLFLGELVTGKAGKIYDRMDMPTFFELFEYYRQQRHSTLMDIRYEEQVNHKAQGPTDRTSEETDKDAHREALADHLKNLYKGK